MYRSVRKKLGAWCVSNPLDLLLIVTAAVFVCLTLAGCVVRTPQRLSVEQEVAREAQIVKLLTEATQELRAAGVGGDDLTRGVVARRRLDHAAAALQLAYEISPRDPRVLDGLGCVSYHRGELALAKSFYQRALVENANYDRAYVHLAAIAEKNGDVVAAHELLNIAIKLNPLNLRARNNLAAMLLESTGEGDLARHRAYQLMLEAYRSGAKNDPVILYNLNLTEQAVQ